MATTAILPVTPSLRKREWVKLPYKKLKPAKGSGFSLSKLAESIAKLEPLEEAPALPVAVKPKRERAVAPRVEEQPRPSFFERLAAWD